MKSTGCDIIFEYGEVPERFNGTVSKTVVGLVSTESSNLSLSALLSKTTNVGPHVSRGDDIRILLSGPLHPTLSALIFNLNAGANEVHLAFKF